MRYIDILRGLFQRKMVVLVIAVVLLFVVLFNSGMFGGNDKRVKISCVGDSLTYGSGVLETRELDSYPAQLQTKLGTSYLVSNYGLRNATASESGDLSYLQSDEYFSSLRSSPDIVVLMLGTNDAKTYNWDSKAYKEGLGELVDTYIQLKTHPTVYLMRCPYCYSLDGGSVAEYDIQPEVVASQVSECIEAVAEEKGCQVIDLYAVTEGRDELYTDGIHFNADGYSVIADTVYDYVK